MARQLESAHRQELHKVAEVQARRRGVESAVVRDRVAGQEIAQSFSVGGHVHEAAPDDLIPDVLERRIVGGLQCSHGGGFRHAFQAISGLGSSRIHAARDRGVPPP